MSPPEKERKKRGTTESWLPNFTTGTGSPTSSRYRNRSNARAGRVRVCDWRAGSGFGFVQAQHRGVAFSATGITSTRCPELSSTMSNGDTHCFAGDAASTIRHSGGPAEEILATERSTASATAVARFVLPRWMQVQPIVDVQHGAQATRGRSPPETCIQSLRAFSFLEHRDEPNTLRHNGRINHAHAQKQLQIPWSLAAKSGRELLTRCRRMGAKGGLGVFRQSDVGLVALPPCRHKTGMSCCTTSVEISQTQCITLSARSLAIGVDLTGHTEARAVRATLVAILHEQVRRHARETATIDREPPTPRLPSFRSGEAGGICTGRTRHSHTSLTLPSTLFSTSSCVLHDEQLSIIRVLFLSSHSYSIIPLCKEEL